jgi:two-component system, cell cycle response regulator
MTARVLVVDDILSNVKLLEAKLAAEYFEVITACNGEQALERVGAEHPPDIVLLDVMMPGMDGFEVCRRIKANTKTTHIPIVMVTALDQPSDRVTGLQAGADDFLTKPVDDTALFARVRSLVRLKMMTDELRMREETGQSMGLADAGETLFEADPTGHILIVEDRPESVAWFRDALDAKNKVADVSSFDEALVLVRGGDFFDLIVVSLGIRAFEGLRLCSHLRSSPEIRNTPILVLVSEGENRKLAQALDMGVNDYLMRPVDRNELMARVKTQLRKKRYADKLRRNMQLSLEMAITDQLTGLHNRRYMARHLDTLMKNASAAKPISFLIMDIDFFKAVNDTYGHDVGDEVLREFAARVSANVRGIDLACRYGGEEFVVVMPDTDTEFAYTVAERLRHSMETTPIPISRAPNKISITASFGIASSTGSGDNSDKLLHRADQALYRAKREGRNRVIAEAA